VKSIVAFLILLSVTSQSWAETKERTVTKGAYDRYWIEDERGRLKGSIKKGAYGRYWIEDERGKLKGSISPSYRNRFRVEEDCENDCGLNLK
jgi:hypothetical protein